MSLDNALLSELSSISRRPGRIHAFYMFEQYFEISIVVQSGKICRGDPLWSPKRPGRHKGLPLHWKIRCENETEPRRVNLVDIAETLCLRNGSNLDWKRMLYE